MTGISDNKNEKFLNLNSKLENDRQLLICCFLSTVFWGMSAHLYGLTNYFPSHDSLVLMANYDTNWKIALGRFMLPIYHKVINTPMLLPWVMGVLAFIYVSAAVFFVVKLLEIRYCLFVVLTAGIMITNISLTAQVATYVQELDCNMLALMLAVLAAYMWKKSNIAGLGLSVVIIALSIGIYQSYLSMTVTLIVLSSVLALLNNEDVRAVVVKGFKGIAVIISGCILYACLYKLSCALTGITPEARTNVMEMSGSPSDLVKKIIDTYYYFVVQLLADKVPPYSEMLIMAVVIISAVTGVLVFVHVFAKNRYKWLNRLMILVLIGLLPFAMDLTFFLSKGDMHDLMNYSIWFLFAVILVMSFWYADKGGFRFKAIINKICCVIILFVILQNIIISNTAYVKKDIESQATLSQMTRVIYEMESQEEYIVGETPVAFIYDDISLKKTVGTEYVKEIIGLKSSSPITYSMSIGNYFNRLLNYPLAVCSDDICDSISENEYVVNMPVFPQKGYCEMIDGVMVVKLP